MCFQEHHCCWLHSGSQLCLSAVDWQISPYCLSFPRWHWTGLSPLRGWYLRTAASHCSWTRWWWAQGDQWKSRWCWWSLLENAPPSPQGLQQSQLVLYENMHYYVSINYCADNTLDMKQCNPILWGAQKVGDVVDSHTGVGWLICSQSLWEDQLRPDKIETCAVGECFYVDYETVCLLDRCRGVSLEPC